MAGFGFSEAQEMFRTEVRNFVQREIAPGANERATWDYIPRDLIKKVGDAGLLGVAIPEKYGGQGSDWVSAGIGIEEIARADFALSIYSMCAQIAYLFLQSATPELQEEQVPPVARGDKIAGFSLTEPDAGSDTAAIKTQAIRDGDYYILNGEKTAFSYGAYADYAMLFAKTDPAAGARGVTAFYLPLDLPGLEKSHYSYMGMKAQGHISLTLDNVRLPARYRASDEGKGFYVGMGNFEFMRPSLGLTALGHAQTALEEAIDYIKQRTAFGRPIAKFEGVSFKIAEHATRIEAARLLCYRTIYMKDQGLVHTKEASMCKWWCPVVAVDAIHDCLLLFGQVGYSEEYPIQQRLKETLGLEIADGTAQIQKTVIAREIIGKEFRAY